MLAPEQTLAGPALPTFDLRALARRAVLPALLLAVAVGFAVVAGGRVHAFATALRRGLSVSPGWVAAGIALECASLCGYVVLLSLVAGRVTPRVRARESAQITLAGAAATRLLPTAGAGGAALTLWSLRRAGLSAGAAARTLLMFLVVLYSVFLGSIVVSGALVALGLAGASGPVELAAIPALVSAGAIALCLLIARRAARDPAASGSDGCGGRAARLRAGARLLGDAVRDALRLVRTGDPRLAGAVAYWALDATVLWAMLHAVGSPASLPVVALAYFAGQAANTLPLPGSVTGGMAGMLIAFGTPAAVAVPAVLAYRAVAVWLPTPAAIAAVPRLHATIERWRREDTRASADGAAAAHA